MLQGWIRILTITKKWRSARISVYFNYHMLVLFLWTSGTGYCQRQDFGQAGPSCLKKIVNQVPGFITAVSGFCELPQGTSLFKDKSLCLVPPQEGTTLELQRCLDRRTVESCCQERQIQPRKCIETPSWTIQVGKGKAGPVNLFFFLFWGTFLFQTRWCPCLRVHVWCGIMVSGTLELDIALGNSLIIIRLSKSSLYSIVMLAGGVIGSMKVSAA